MGVNDLGVDIKLLTSDLSSSLSEYEGGGGKRSELKAEGLCVVTVFALLLLLLLASENGFVACGSIAGALVKLPCLGGSLGGAILSPENGYSIRKPKTNKLLFDLNCNLQQNPT